MSTTHPLDIIKPIDAFKELISIGGEIFCIGGCVRDYYLGKESKDIDIVVRNVDDKTLIDTLVKYGKVDKVGETFGVIKFKPFGWTSEPIDIALPRKDVLVDKTLGHHGIKAEFDHTLSIEEDLYRRDCRLNSIAISWDNVIIDPFDGLGDINNKLISATSLESFKDDPLRILRVLQFSSRFNFMIEPNTFKMIEDSKSDIKYITGERILEELEKIYHKGNIQYGINLLVNTGLHKEIFGFKIIKNIGDDLFFNKRNTNIITKGDFYYIICGSTLFKTILKGDIKTEKEIKAIELINNSIDIDLDIVAKRKLFYDAIQISKSILSSGILTKEFMLIQKDFNNNLYPKSLKELDVNGDDLINMGYIGIEIGNKLNELLMERLSK